MQITRILGLLLFIIAALLAPVAQATFCVPPSPPAPPPPAKPPCPACEPIVCEKCNKSPVFAIGGSYTRDETDLSIRTTGFGITVARSYDSSRAVDGPMGIGWTSSLTPRVHYASFAASATALQHIAYVAMPNGMLYEFKKNEADLFIPPVGRFESLVRNADGTFQLTLQHSRNVYKFRADGAIEYMQDEFGNRINYTYDLNGRLQRVADGAGSGRYVDVTWNSSTGRIGSVTDNAGRTVRYTYDTSGNLETVADAVTPTGEASRYYEYVQGRMASLLSRVEDRWHRLITRVAWDSSDRVTSYTEGEYNENNPAASAGEKYTYEYNLNGTTEFGVPHIKKINSISFNYYIPGQDPNQIGVIGSDGKSYNTIGQLDATSNEDGVQTANYTYDAQGRMITRRDWIDANISVLWTFTYDATWPDKISTVKSDQPSKWRGTRYTYYSAAGTAPGALQSVYRYRTDGTTEDLHGTFTYDATGRLLSAANVPDQPAATYTYYPAGDLKTVTKTGTPAVTFEYDTLGRPTKVINQSGHAFVYTYDATDRVKSVTLPKPSAASTLNFTTTTDYDQYDALTGLVFTDTTDANDRTTRTGADALGRVVQVIDAKGNITTHSYQYNLLKSISDANGNTTTYEYDQARKLASTTFPDNSVEQYTRSFWAGRLKSVTDRRGTVQNLTYDRQGRLTKVWFPVSGKAVTYVYDGENVASIADEMVSPSRTYEFAYDTLFRVTSEGYQTAAPKTEYAYRPSDAGSLPLTYTIRPPAGNPDRVTTVHYTYDTASRVQTLSFDGVTAEATITYDPRGMYSRIDFANGMYRQYGYDNQSRLTQVANAHATAGTIATFAYAYDTDWTTGANTMLGRRVQVSVTAHASANQVLGVTRYRYDDGYQLVQVDNPNGTWEKWQYDAIGNRTSFQTSAMGSPSTYSFYKFGSNQNNSPRLQNAQYRGGAPDYTYDANGNRLTGGASWDVKNRLAAYGAESYDYDWMDRRIAAGNNMYAYHGMNAVRERNAASAVLNDYIFGPGIDEPLVRKDAAGTKVYFAADGLGSVVALTGAAGSIVTGRSYDVWGKVNGGASALAFGYTGREPGPSGLLYYRARPYDPVDARFISDDPLVSSSGRAAFEINQNGRPSSSDASIQIMLSVLRASHPYTYVLNDPVSAGDPLGTGVISSILCFYYYDKCLADAIKCGKKNDCLFDPDKPEDLESQETGWAGTENFKKCFAGSKPCKKAMKWCGPDYLGGPPGFPPLGELAASSK
ncbi:MAG TPA: RHS repeat-associated core domain-containing protein [Thermoanaerobaculia bacterium]|nr:RHS repeat-associated core domain-containing protein [Thermoanaerobaculia bacterium]